ncbi:DUF1798 family protein [Desertibacillus haloalkaliphilus]|uniref:DUF1798 family protein n=1 Tax=Desertibacillus haloalkaliphilus TaxID=1328930 RepID=UPI001C2632CA|nr:DUF1798 family protein [Desertibacillus haloalkaliphilus]MBU8907297.1 YppE family protein [Desertibacillus haloalkaliphilus]
MEQNQQLRLKELTNELRRYNELARQQFVEDTCKTDYQVNFYERVKPFADAVLALADEWRPLAMQWVIEMKPTYVYGIQIKDTYENITISSVQAFQTDTKKKRFLEMIKSIDYVLATIEQQLPK